MTIGQRIKAAREAADMTQEHLGRICGITKQAVYKYEAGIVTNIPIDRLERIAQSLGVSSAYLMGWEKETPVSISKSKHPAQTAEWNIYTRIRSRREELGLSQEELAARMGYKSKSSINKIEMGVNDIPQSKVLAFAKALGTTTAYLMGCDEEKETPAPISEGERPDPTIARIIDIVRQLSPETQMRCLEYFESLLALQNAAQAPNTPD